MLVRDGDGPDLQSVARMNMLETRSLALPEARESAFEIVDTGIGQPDPNTSLTVHPGPGGR